MFYSYGLELIFFAKANVFLLNFKIWRGLEMILCNLFILWFILYNGLEKLISFTCKILRSIKLNPTF